MTFSKRTDLRDEKGNVVLFGPDELPDVQTTTLSKDLMGRYICNSFEEAVPDENALLNYDVIVLTQSCDLQAGQGKPKVQHVVLCPIEGRSRIEEAPNHVLHNKGILRKAARGEHPGFFVISDFFSRDLPELNRDVGVVHFQQIYTLPVDLVRNHAASLGPRLRLRSPYREALSSRFASFFGRVALNNPVTI